MKNFTLVLVSLFFHQGLSSIASHEAAIRDTDTFAEAVTGVAGSSLSYETCCPTVTDLANISLDLALTEASQMLVAIETMLKNQTWESGNQTCLVSCLDLYNCAVASLNNAADALARGHYSGLSSWVDSARECVEECEYDFGGASPITKENNYFFQLCHIAFDISLLSFLPESLGSHDQPLP